MSEFVAVSNNDFEIEVTPNAAATNVIATPNNGTATPIAPAKFGINDVGKTEDDNCKVQGDKFLVQQLNETTTGVPPVGGAATDFSCAPLTGASVWTAGGIYIILAGSLKTKCSNKSVLLENDSTTVNCFCAGSNNVSPVPQGFTGSCSIKISKAGQDKVKSE